MKIVADTNVIISMLLWGKSLERLLDLINTRGVVLCFSPQTIDELFRVIRYPQITKQVQKTKVLIEILLDKLISSSIICYPNKTFDTISEDESDNQILETAYTAKATAIVSGDKHLLKIKNFIGIPIYSPAQFLNIHK